MPPKVLSFEVAQSAAQQGRLEKLSEAQKDEARLYSLRLVRDPVYRKVLLHDLRARKVSGTIEAMVWAYAYGRPPERIEIGRIGDTDLLDGLSREELAARAKALSNWILEQPSEEETEPELSEKEAQSEVNHILANRLAKPRRPAEARLTLSEVVGVIDAEGIVEENL